MKVKDYMRKKVATVDQKDSVTEASKEMLANGVGYLVVLEKGRPSGIVTDRDIVHRAIAKGLNPSTTTVDAIMSSPIVPVDPDASVEAAVEMMVNRRLKRLPVVKDGIIYGVFTARDLIDHFEELEDRLARQIVRGAFFLA